MAELAESKIYDCDNLPKFIKTIKAILPYRGYSNAQFFINQVNENRYLTKLTFYRKSNKEMYADANPNTSHQSDAEIQILELFKKTFLDTNATKNIIKIIHYNTCENVVQIAKTLDCDALSRDQSNDEKTIIHHLFCKNSDLVAAGVNVNKYSFICMEQGDITLRKYITKYINYNVIGDVILKSLIFQIIHCYNLIKQKFPDFQHNDLHTDNILCTIDSDFKFDYKHPQTHDFKFGNKTYKVPFFGITPKIIDFGFSSIESQKIISHIVDDKSIMFNRPKNDLLFLLYDINDFVEIESIVELIDTLDPTGYYYSFNAAFLRRHPEIEPTPAQMMESTVWDEYLN